MAGKCDHTSVGMLVWKEGRLLLIERMKFPFGFAPPAGHVDGDSSFEIAAKRELEEEVGLETKEMNLRIKGRMENKCRRKDGSWHYWKIYEMEVTGELKRSESETKKAGFFSLEEIKTLAKKTEKYLKKEISDSDWGKSPGIETVWFEWFKKLGII